MPMCIVRHTALLLCLIAGTVRAQDLVRPSSFSFSDGVHPTFTSRFEGTDDRYVESWWRDELRNISASVSSKKELTASAALVPGISPDTLRIQVKVEQRKGSPHTEAHVAIKSTAGYIGPNGEQGAYQAAFDFVQQRSTTLRRQLAQQELSAAEKGLDQLRNALNDLEREHERALSSVEKQKQKASEAVEEQGRTREELDAIHTALEKQQRLTDADPSEGNVKDLRDMQKDRDHVSGRHQKAINAETGALKKTSELEWSIRQNLEEQERKKASIAEQETLVRSLQEKLEGIR